MEETGRGTTISRSCGYVAWRRFRVFFSTLVKITKQAADLLPFSDRKEVLSGHELAFTVKNVTTALGHSHCTQQLKSELFALPPGAMSYTRVMIFGDISSNELKTVIVLEISHRPGTVETNPMRLRRGCKKSEKARVHFIPHSSSSRAYY